jgi:hypothetical protein
VPFVQESNNSVESDLLERQGLLLDSLPALSRTLPKYVGNLHPTVVHVADSELQYCMSFSRLLADSISSLILQYHSNSDLQEIVPLDELTSFQLERLASVPYQSGILRPDLLYECNSGIPQVCEVNARFAFNACVLSEFVQNALVGQEALVPAFNGEALRNYIDERFSGSVLILKERERGYDIHYVQAVCGESRIRTTYNVKTSDFSWADTIILELHQDELERVLPQVVSFMLEGKQVLNDPRSVMLAHDKRLLVALYESTFECLQNGAAAQTLNQGIIPSFLKIRSPEIFEAALAEPEKWVAKRAISGKGDGVFFGSLISHQHWQGLLNQTDILLQPYLEQKKYQTIHLETNRAITTNLVATSVILNNEPLGFGLFRYFSTPPITYCALAPTSLVSDKVGL